MPTCFVIQPFDGGDYDKLFDEIYGPAIVAAGLEPYRVDRDPAVSIPIEQIEQGIRNATACLVDISEDNPNVWFEFGFAIAEQKEIAIVCHLDRRSRFPFDIQHRKVIGYRSSIPSAFNSLREQITDSLTQSRLRVESLAEVEAASPIVAKEGLSDHEITLLAVITNEVSGPEGGISHWLAKQGMEKLGYTPLATLLAARKLITKKYIAVATEQDHIGDNYQVYAITTQGWEWMIENEARFTLRAGKAAARSPGFGRSSTIDDETPF